MWKRFIYQNDGAQKPFPLFDKHLMGGNFHFRRGKDGRNAKSEPVLGLEERNETHMESKLTRLTVWIQWTTLTD